MSSGDVRAASGSPVCVPPPSPSELPDIELEGLMRLLLQGIIPDCLIDPFLRANGLATAPPVPLSAQRTKFILDQIVLVVEACNTVEGTDGDLLTDILGQRDVEGRPVDWLLADMTSVRGDASGVLPALLQLHEEDEQSQSPPQQDGARGGEDGGGGHCEGLVASIRSSLVLCVCDLNTRPQQQQFLQEAVMTQLTDEAIMQCVQAADGDVDAAVAMLLDLILNSEWTSSASAVTDSKGPSRRRRHGPAPSKCE